MKEEPMKHNIHLLPQDITLTVPDGECRINPPRLSGFPIVPADKCCGRFSRAKALRISPPKIY
jgi:hypothetical protein